MKYVSTRGGAPAVGFADAMITGLAPDGGLYVPETVPAIDAAQLDDWRRLDYAELAAAVVQLFATDIDQATISAATTDAYSAEVFGSAEVAPLARLGEESWLLRLSNGPTLAFKDMAMQLLGRLFDEELTQRNESLLILGATSGDTGSSAEYAMVGRSNIAVVMLSPWQKVSPFQAAQMYSLDAPNIANIAIRGVFDEAQDLVKAITGDTGFKAKYSLGAVNSINWARVAAQVVYYVWAYLRLAPPAGVELQVVVPTGNFGNIYAGTIARRMGIPLRFILATNENNVLDEFFRTGIYRVRSNAQVAETSSPSMDIAKASNFERFVYDLYGGDGAAVGALWRQLEEVGEFDLSAHPSFADLSDWIVSGSSSHADRIRAIRKVAVEAGLVIDPHTADGIHVGGARRGEGPTVYLETAQPAKFAATMREALGQEPWRPAELMDLEERPQHVVVVDSDAERVKDEIVRFSNRWRA